MAPTKERAARKTKEGEPKRPAARKTTKKAAPSPPATETEEPEVVVRGRLEETAKLKNASNDSVDVTPTREETATDGVVGVPRRKAIAAVETPESVSEIAAGTMAPTKERSVQKMKEGEPKRPARKAIEKPAPSLQNPNSGSASQTTPTATETEEPEVVVRGRLEETAKFKMASNDREESATYGVGAVDVPSREAIVETPEHSGPVEAVEPMEATHRDFLRDVTDAATSTPNGTPLGRKRKAPAPALSPVPESGSSTTTRRRRRNATQLHKVRLDFSRYLHKVHKEVNDGLTVSVKTMNILNSFVLDTFDKCAEEAGRLSHRAGRSTLTLHDMQCAVRLVLRTQTGHLHAHAHAEGLRALNKFLHSSNPD